MNGGGRLGVVALAIAVVVLGVAWANRSADGRRAIAEADVALARGEWFDAIMAARTAAEARCPFCSASAEGFSRLERIAHDAEKRGDASTAFAAWRAVRAACLGSVLLQRRSDLRTRAEGQLARLSQRIDAEAVAAGAPPSPAASETKMRATLAEDEIPGALSFLILALGSLAFVAGAIRFVTKDDRREIVLAAVGAATAASAVFF